MLRGARAILELRATRVLPWTSLPKDGPRFVFQSTRPDTPGARGGEG
ncbi:MAG TPA: hypothetical protein VIG64_09720 [Actinomycetota bacterium]